MDSRSLHNFSYYRSCDSSVGVYEFTHFVKPVWDLSLLWTFSISVMGRNSCFVNPSQIAKFRASVVLNYSCYVLLGLNWHVWPSRGCYHLMPTLDVRLNPWRDTHFPSFNEGVHSNKQVIRTLLKGSGGQRRNRVKNIVLPTILY